MVGKHRITYRGDGEDRPIVDDDGGRKRGVRGWVVDKVLTSGVVWSMVGGTGVSHPVRDRGGQNKHHHDEGLRKGLFIPPATQRPHKNRRAGRGRQESQLELRWS
jgi:hypothetical protein